ncbi:hypothetical protein PPECC33_p3239 (plasmid) [Escherichia coli PCN033]|uniref:Uncharacterized protein n=1 Tax=Escherichia coli TaxID=562 RepID=A0A3G1QCF7_ECOLX|nr:hypothetical protein PPECC33_p3239 [Escherichia coli PCN033]AWH57812.1 hypothetical protein [Escherichia coli]
MVYPVIFFSILASLAPENLDNSKNTPGTDESPNDFYQNH